MYYPQTERHTDRVNPPAHSRGFNLIEAAIVLGVVGLVIGGIWSAASTVHQKMILNAAIQGSQTSINKLRNILPLNQPDGYVTSLAISASLVPADWIRGTEIYAPTGNRISIVVVSGVVAMDWSPSPPISSSFCINFFTGLGVGKNSVDGGANGSLINSTAHSLSWIQSACRAADPIVGMDVRSTLGQ